jgi:hypothetical protein
MDKKPREIRIHQLVEERRLEDEDSCQHLITCKGHRILWVQASYRLYLEFCKAGDVHHATVASYRNEDCKETKGKKLEDRLLPEPFIWWVIKCMASACLTLDRGTQSADRVTDWLPIMHLDLGNTQNTFLAMIPNETPEMGPVDNRISSVAERSRQERKRSADDTGLPSGDETVAKELRVSCASLGKLTSSLT